MKRKKMFDTKQLTDAVLGALAVNNAPLILSKLNIPFQTGMSGQISGAAVALLLSQLLKKPAIANVGVAVAVANIVDDLVKPMLQSNNVLPANNTTMQLNAGLKDYVSVPKLVTNYKRFYS
ncbi:hypothetical protein MROS_2527 [Melioribacter roseus P3M-2]|jgi:hypothetical protein|uniref:Uncharacterized protein n=1 Tax=Melioribacter roseus (strain DSM 23840 / JCM 17771 / VKM B-2668 / P3M-2) TaxID=1191523 RepID=I6YYU6_MELRP|nr:hypothetical protein [Melioribacter roseus]AFN75757.1 hypothetical protein MROS_2527 [Melioribacter roseus P3M-2]